MASTRKEIRLREAGREHVIGDAADWEEVAIAVDVYLDQGGYDPAWHLDPTTRVEAKDHYSCALTTDA
jgi:hypothetical protein